MSKKLIIDIDNFPIGFYETEIHTSIPVEAIDITEEQWQEFIENPGLRKWNLTTLEVDVYIPSIDINIEKSNAQYQIDAISETQRLKYITSGYGQTLTYQEKAEEASDYIVAGSPVDLTPYPFIQAEANATGKDATTAANDILVAQSLWISKGSSIEEKRIKAKIDIDNAITLDDITNIVTLAISSIEII